MNVREFERLVSRHGASAASLDAITRHLRAFGLLPLGGRGPNAPDTTPDAAAVILLVLAGVTNPNSREQVSRLLADFGCAPGQLRQPNAVRDFLTEILAEPAAAALVTEVRVSRDNADVTIQFEDGRRDIYRSLSEADLRDRGAERQGCELEYVLRQSLLVQASTALSSKTSAA